MPIFIVIEYRQYSSCMVEDFQLLSVVKVIHSSFNWRSLQRREDDMQPADPALQTAGILLSPLILNAGLSLGCSVGSTVSRSSTAWLRVSLLQRRRF